MIRRLVVRSLLACLASAALALPADAADHRTAAAEVVVPPSTLHLLSRQAVERLRAAPERFDLELVCDEPLAGDFCVVAAADGPQPIPDENLTIFRLRVDLEDLGLTGCVLEDLNVALQIDHERVDELDILADHQARAATVYSHFATGTTCDATVIDAVFSDEAALPPNGCPADGMRRYQPVVSFDVFDGLPANGTYSLLIDELAAGNTGTLNQLAYALDITCDPIEEPPPAECVPGPATLCLQDGRFQVEARWSDFTGSEGPALVRPGSDSSGVLYFFDPDNFELMVKVLDACGFDDRFWVFAGGLTNVEVEITVTDTLTGETKMYDNPLGTPFQPVQDTRAFATCP